MPIFAMLRAAFHIERNVPMAKKMKRSHPIWDTFSRMTVGDSFLIGPDKKKYQSAANHAVRYGKTHNASFAFRNTVEG